MKTRVHFFLLLSFFLLLISNSKSLAQPPWRAKLFVHFLDSNNQIVTDTVWFGCDSLGNVGYQPGLDVIDTSLQWNKLYSADDLVKTQFNTDCANLKTNIREFNIKGVNPRMRFQFYAIGQPVSMSWDTNDYIYQIDSTYRISGIINTAQNGYLYAMDAQQYIMGGDKYTRINNIYIYKGFSMNSPDSIRIYMEGIGNECRKEQYAFSFQIDVEMGWHQFTGLDRDFMTDQFIIYPNPFREKIVIESSNGLLKKGYRYSILSAQGIEQLQGTIDNSLQEIDMNFLPPGIYFITIQDNNSFISKPYKLIKL